MRSVVMYPALDNMKVFTSLLLQQSIAIIACLALTGFEMWPSSKGNNEKVHSHALATALVEFHKNQCYFISAIEIAALVLGKQAIYAAGNIYRVRPFFDILLSIPLSMNGLVPIAFALIHISRYGRLSWHIILLSVITMILSTGSLVTTWGTRPWEGVSSNSEWGTFTFGAFGSSMRMFEFGDLVCGSGSSIVQRIGMLKTINYSLVWVVYSNCMLWVIWCIVKHVSNGQSKESYLNRVLKFWDRIPGKIVRNKLSSRTLSYSGYTIFLLIWALCFGYHIYWYTILVSHNLVSRTWSFGQIIAVTAWAPSIVEFFYIEYSELIVFKPF